jgi:hypothetical protein
VGRCSIAPLARRQLAEKLNIRYAHFDGCGPSSHRVSITT